MKLSQESIKISALPEIGKGPKIPRPMKHQLDFEKPIAELQSKLEELRKHPEAHSLGISFKEEIAQIEKKIAETRKQIF